MHRSKYHTEHKSEKSNALTSAGLTVVLVILGLALAWWLIMNTGNYLESSQYNDRASQAIDYAGYSYSSIEYVAKTSDEPSRETSRVHSFKVINFRAKSGGAPIGEAIVKCELGSYDALYDKFVSYKPASNFSSN
jgi:hypothetical protein